MTEWKIIVRYLARKTLPRNIENCLRNDLKSHMHGTAKFAVKKKYFGGIFLAFLSSMLLK